MCGREKDEKEIGKVLVVVQDPNREFLTQVSLRTDTPR